MVLAAWTASPAHATDYFVRSDGSDASAGTANSAAGAFRTVGKCASLAKAGDRCLVQPGRYSETGVTQASGGGLVAAAVNTCACTRGSTTVTCTAAVAGQVAPGTFVRCAGGKGFAWSRVAAAGGTAITLAEPYRGASVARGALDVARFVEIVGQGASPRDVVLTEFRARDPLVAWEKVAGKSCLWRYVKANALDPTWKYPTGFREDVADAAWNLFVEQKNGRDLYYRLWATGQAPAGSGGDCPCQAGAVPEQVETVPGSWGDDGTHVYLQTRACVAPDAAKVLAGRHGTGGEQGATLVSQQPYTIVENLSVDVAGFDSAVRTSLAYGFVLGASNARYSRLHQEGGRFQLFPPQDSVDTLFEHVRTLEGSQCQLSTGHSGLRLYDVEIRGGSPDGFSCDTIRGASADDPIVFERMYVHRTFAALSGVAACDGGTTWDCAAHAFKPCLVCEEQDPRLFAGRGASVADVATDNGTDHVVVRNSVVEVATDGWGLFHGGGGQDVWFVNNTFGVNHRLDDGLKAMVGTAGANGNWGARLYNNLFVLGKAPAGGVRYLGARGTIVSDYNLFMPFAQDGSARVWNEGETLAYVVATYGQEAHSALVCKSGCADAQGTYFNDDGESGLVDPSVLDGTPTDYTPKAGFRGLDQGTNAVCPEEDFLGRPRNDGACDIGAIERPSAAQPPDAGAEQAPDVGAESLPDAAVAASPDAGADAGSVPSDGGAVAPPSGCGCGAGGPTPACALLLVCLLLGATTRTHRGTPE